MIPIPMGKRPAARLLPVVLAIGVMAVGGPIQAGPIATAVSSLRPTAAEQQIVDLANQARADAGLGPLVWDSALAAAARRHAIRMADVGPIAHRYGGEPGLAERAAQAGARFSLIAENIAFGPSPMVIHDSWMRSAPHRANLLDPRLTAIGVALVSARGELYAVQDFSRAVPQLTPAQVESELAALVIRPGMTLDSPNAARLACAQDNGIPAGARFVMRWQTADLATLPQPLEQRLASGQYHGASVGACSMPGRDPIATPSANWNQRQGQSRPNDLDADPDRYPAEDSNHAFTAYRLAVLLY